MHVCNYACMHVCMYVCMYVCFHTVFSPLTNSSKPQLYGDKYPTDLAMNRSILALSWTMYVCIYTHRRRLVINIGGAKIWVTNIGGQKFWENMFSDNILKKF